MVDRKAWKILKSIYWSSTGWRDIPEVPSDEDRRYATEAGYLFESRDITHDQAMSWAHELVSQTTAAAVGKAFVVSLMGDRLPLRSAIGAYAVLSQIPAHSFEEKAMPSAFSNLPICEICDGFAFDHHDFSADNFSRHMWGNTSNYSPTSLAFCLDRFLAEDPPEPEKEHYEVLKRIIEQCSTSESDCTPTKLADSLKGIVGGNKEQIRQLVETLGFCRVLHPPPGETEVTRKVPVRLNFFGPAAAWRGRDGVDPAAIETFFPGFLEQYKVQT